MYEVRFKIQIEELSWKVLTVSHFQIHQLVLEMHSGSDQSKVLLYKVKLLLVLKLPESYKVSSTNIPQ